MRRIIGKLRRAWTVYRDFGPSAFVSRLMRRIKSWFGSDDFAHAMWFAQKVRADEEFDSRYGIETGGLQEIFGYTIVGSNARHGLSHIATDPDQFAKLFASVDIDASQHTFIDLGAGKGRALILAALLPFRRIIGVEFAAELAAAAMANLERIASTVPACRSIEVVCADAAEYRFPKEPVVIYLFNPFGSIVVRRVAENLLSSWRQAPRSVVVFYMNAVHLDDFLATGWRLKADTGTCAILVPGG